MHGLSLAAGTFALLLSPAFAAQLAAACIAPQKWTLIPAANRPNTRLCETLGHLNAPAPIASSFHSPSLNDCISACKATPNDSPGAKCISFGYSSKEQTCTLYSKRLIDQQYRDRRTNEGTLYSNMLCYKCGCPALAAGGNAIQNGGFQTAGASESEAAYWTYYPGSTNYRIRYARKCSGEECVAAFTPYDEYSALDENLTQMLQCLSPGTQYQFSFVASGIGSLPESYLYVFLNDNQIHNFTLDQPDNYMYSATVVAPNGQAGNQTLRLNAYNPTYDITDDVTFDNISLVPLGAL